MFGKLFRLLDRIDRASGAEILDFYRLRSEHPETWDRTFGEAREVPESSASREDRLD